MFIKDFQSNTKPASPNKSGFLSVFDELVNIFHPEVLSYLHYVPELQRLLYSIFYEGFKPSACGKLSLYLALTVRWLLCSYTFERR